MKGRAKDSKDYYVLHGPPDKADPREAFAVKLSVALHRYGTPAHRLEQTMDMILERMGLKGEIFVMPTSIFASFGRPWDYRTTLIRDEIGDVNLERLSALDELAEEVIVGKIGYEEGSRRIEQIVRTPPRYGPAMIVAATAVATGAAARIFGGGWREIVVAATVGAGVGLLSILFSKVEQARRVFETAAGILAAAIVAAAARYFTPFSEYIATLAGLIILLPGLRLTTAMTEIATGHLVSGTARLTGALMVFLGLSFGVALGGQVGRLLGPALPSGAPLPLPDLTFWIALILSPIASGLLLRARPRDVAAIALAGGIAFMGSRLGAHLFGPQLGAFLGSLTLAFLGNLYSRLRHRPSSILIAPGLLLLVPGSLGFRSLSRMMEQDVVTGVGTAFNVAVVGIAIVTGLLLAHALLPSKRGL